MRPSGAVTKTLAKRRSEWVPAANPKALLVLWPVLPKLTTNPRREQIDLGYRRRDRPRLLRHPVTRLDRPLTARSPRHLGTDDAVAPMFTMKIAQRCPNVAPRVRLDGASAEQHLGCAPNASAQPWTRTTQWMPMVQRGANMGPRRSSACLLPAGLWHRSTVGPLDFQLAVTILQTESSRRSTTTDERCHPRPHHRPAA